MSCDNDCSDECNLPVAFPRLIFNRPALPRIKYRIGSYGDMRAHMMSRLDQAPALAAWTHRGSDDPGIALLEATAIVGDILSTYQDDYANETLLRTATLPASVTGLVRLLGYRPAPGIGGQARFALAVKGTLPVTVPAGLMLDAQLEGAPKAATFETSAELLAVPALSSFHLYRPRRVPEIVNGIDTFQLGAAGDVLLKPGDKLMVGLQHSPAANGAYDHTQVMVVDKVWDAFGIRYVKTKGRLECLAAMPTFTLMPSFTTVSGTVSAGATQIATLIAAQTTSASLDAGVILNSSTALAIQPLIGFTFSALAAPLHMSVSALPAYSGLLFAGLAVATVTSTPRLVAWKLGADFKHFGHAAPATRIAVDANGRASEVAVAYDRVLDSTQGDPAGPGLRPLQLPLEGQVKDINAGVDVLVEANLATTAGGSPRKRLLARRVRQIDGQSMAWGGQTGAATVLTLDADLAVSEDSSEGSSSLRFADIRAISVHAVQGAAFELRAAPVATSAMSGNTLDFYGSATDAQALLDRTLLLMEPRGPVAAHAQQVRPQTEGEPRFEVRLDRVADYRLYGHDEPGVDVHGNLVDASEGKTEPETVLGDGDGRADFQTFALAKPPLTYLLDTTQSPPQRPELEVRVGGLLWQRVESFFDAAPRDSVYIVREADDGKSFVQFGDGVRGARLPTGKGNVLATWRVGSGSRGPLKTGASVSAKPRFAGFDKAWLREPVTGGAAPEAAHSVKRAAPGSLQSLGRIVSLADFESEALSLPGVLKARASWLLMDGAPVLCLTVLTDGLEAADRVALDAALRSAVAARSPGGNALWLRLGNRRFSGISLRIGFDARRRVDDMSAAVQLALGTCSDETALDDAPTDGLFDWQQRQFGQDVHGSQVVGRVQNAPGVAWVELLGMSLQPAPVALGMTSVSPPLPTTVSPVALPAVQRRLVCPADSLLALHRDRLAIDWLPVTLTAQVP